MHYVKAAGGFVPAKEALARIVRAHIYHRLRFATIVSPDAARAPWGDSQQRLPSAGHWWDRC